MKKSIKILNELCIAVTESINSQEIVDRALFLCLYPFSTKNLSICQVIGLYYDSMFKQQWPQEILQSKIRNRTLELISKIEECISDSMGFAHLPIYRDLELLDKITTENLVHARKIYERFDFQHYFDFNSYRRLKAVSTLEEMTEVSDFRTKQFLLRYKVLKTIEEIGNLIIRNLAMADIIFYGSTVKCWTPAQCLKMLNEIRAFCSKNYIPEYALYDDKTKILKDYCSEDKLGRAQLLLDNVYNEFGLRRLDKQDICAIIYLLYEKREKLGFGTNSLCKFSQFKEKIYEYYRLSPSTYKRNQIIERADRYRNAECISMI